MTTHSNLNWKLRLAFGSAILALTVVGGISYRSMVVSQRSDQWVRHTHEVLEDLQNLLTGMETAESSARGFILTGKDVYLDSYRASIASSEQIETNVRNLTVDNPVQQRQLSELDRTARQKFDLAQKAIDLRKSAGLAAALDAVQAATGQQIVNDYRDVIREMQDEEVRLLVLREADAKQRLRQTKIVLILGTALGVLIAIGAAWSALRDHTARTVSEDAMREGEDRFRILANSISQQSGAKYRGLLEAAPDAMVVVNEGGEIVLLNLQAEKQFGYHRDELVGQKVKNIIPEGFAERLVADETRTAAEALAQQIGTGIELTGRRKDGGEFPIEIMLSPLESVEGMLVTAAIRDISVRKAAERHLAQMEGRYRGLLEAAPDAMVVVNQGGEIVLLNVQAENQFGYSRDELLGQIVKTSYRKALRNG